MAAASSLHVESDIPLSVCRYLVVLVTYDYSMNLRENSSQPLGGTYVSCFYQCQLFLLYRSTSSVYKHSSHLSNNYESAYIPLSWSARVK